MIGLGRRVQQIGLIPYKNISGQGALVWEVTSTPGASGYKI